MGDHGIDDGVHPAFHHQIQLVEGEADAVVGEAVLREVVGADLLTAVTGTHHALALSADGRLLLDGQPTTEPALREAVRAAKEKNKDVICLIAGDKDARHGDVTHIIDLVKQEGVAKFAINIDPLPPSSP